MLNSKRVSLDQAHESEKLIKFYFGFDREIYQSLLEGFVLTKEQFQCFKSKIDSMQREPCEQLGCVFQITVFQLHLVCTDIFFLKRYNDCECLE